MPFNQFNLYEDDTLDTEFSGTFQFLHYTDLSDNPQDTVLYLGSIDDTVQLQATSNPGVAEITITPTYILPEWDNATAYTVGQKVEPTTPNGYVYKCTDAGTSAGSEPSWPIPPSGFGSTVVDGGVIWELHAPRHPITEVKLALTSGGLSSATGGAALNLGNTILGGVAEAQPIHIRITNSVTSTSNNTGNEELAVYLNSCLETEIP